MIATLFSKAFQSDVETLLKKVDKSPSYAEWNETDKETIKKHLQAAYNYIEECHREDWKKIDWYRITAKTNPRKRHGNSKK